MPPLLKVNGRDLSTYLQAQNEAGFDPVDPDREEPAWAGSPAMREGMEFVGDTVDNREWTIPLLLSASTRAGLHQLVRDIEGELERGARVEFATDSADDVTAFDLEAGRLEVAYQFFLSVHATSRAVLRLWTAPQGHTATQRLIASVPGTGPQEFVATGIRGDRSALADLEVVVGSNVATAGRVVGYGVARSASYRGIRLASSLTGQASSLATAEPTSSIGSTMLAIPVSPTGASGVAAVAYLSPPEAYQGRHRVLAPLRSNLADTSHLTVSARDRFGAPLGATVIASQNNPARMMLADLGTISVPARASGQEPVPTQEIRISAGGASGASYAQASGYPLTLGGLLLLPLERSPGLLRTPGIDGDAALYTDSFARLTGAVPVALHNSPAAESGGVNWTRVAGYAGAAVDSFWGPVWPGKLGPIASSGAAAGGWRPLLNASALYALASGALNTDVEMSGRVALNYGASPAGASSTVELWAKAITNGSVLTAGVGARICLLPGSAAIQLVSASGGATAGLASLTAATAAAIASQLHAGAGLTMTVRVQGATAVLFMGTAAQNPPSVLAANAAMLAAPGWPAVRMNAGSNIASAVITVDDLAITALSAGASDIGPRETFRFEAYPQERAYQGNASVFLADRVAQFRGRPPQLPPLPSSGASGPARVIVFESAVDDFRGNDRIDVNLTALERFSFLR